MDFSEVAVPVIDLRADPTAEPLMVRGHDRRRLTQLLFGQCVHVIRSSCGWCEVQAPEQMIGHGENNPRPYKGFVREEVLRRKERCSCRSSQGVAWSEDIANRLILKSRSYLSQPYLWGGLSEYNPSSAEVHTGPDCSGLVWRAYEEIGMLLPRNAVDQCVVGQPIAPQDLRRGDLVFTAPPGGAVNHVLVYVGPSLIEATARDGAVVREILPEDRFGFSLSSGEDGAIFNDTQFFFRRYIPVPNETWDFWRVKASIFEQSKTPQ